MQDKNAAPLNQLDVLMEEIYEHIMELADKVSEAAWLAVLAAAVTPVAASARVLWSHSDALTAAQLLGSSVAQGCNLSNTLQQRCASTLPGTLAVSSTSQHQKRTAQRAMSPTLPIIPPAVAHVCLACSWRPHSNNWWRLVTRWVQACSCCCCFASECCLSQLQALPSAYCFACHLQQLTFSPQHSAAAVSPLPTC